ncbi:MAG: hypothetical protein ABI779_19820 [Acidobacteriota bacterium]
MTEILEVRPRTSLLRPLLEGAVVVVFVLLIWNNYSLRRQAHAVAVPSVREHGFVPRDAVRSIPTLDLDGKPGTWNLQSGRHVLAIVDPRCDSCRALIATLPGHGDGQLYVLSVAPPADTRAMAQQAGLTAATRSLGTPLPRDLESQLQIYPQLLIVDQGKVVRTCASIAECAP